MFCAISSAEMLSSHFCHVSLFQISSLVPTPIITASFSRLAAFLKLFYIKNLPCLSISHSVAPDKKNLTKFLAFLSDNGSAFNLASKFNHSFCENANKHPSNPFVTMNFSPMSCLNLAGIINLPLTSRECSYSPISN